MLCKIADLVVEVPEENGLATRVEKYRCNDTTADIVICPQLYEPEYWPKLSENDMAYMESGVQFYSELLRYDGMMLHASAVELDGRGYLFFGSCGAGKSTHTRLWQQVFGENAQVFNDDKPALRYLNNKWYAFGTPWCGKDGINQNKKVPLAGICHLKQANVNRIRRLGTIEATQKIVMQTPRIFKNQDKLELMLCNLDKLVKQIPVFELENRPEPAAVQLSYKTMCKAAEVSCL